MRIVIIGGGASGMLASSMISKNNKVILVEKNEKLGKKLYITGKGRCNVKMRRSLFHIASLGLWCMSDSRKRETPYRRKADGASRKRLSEGVREKGDEKDFSLRSK